MLKILVVEDVPAMQTQIVNYLTRQLSGYAVVTARHRAEALQRVMDDKPNLILLDLVIPPDGRSRTGSWTEGRDVLRYVKTHHPFIKVIVLTSRGEKARDFLKEEGADDFFAKDAWDEWAQGKLVLAIEECIGYLVCRSSAMQRVREQLETIGEDAQFVLLEGEPGAGKRYLVHVMHRCSPRAHLRLEELDCSTLNEEDLLVTLLGRQGERSGVLGNRETGTVLLHRMESLSPQAQQRLAAVLESLCGAAASPRVMLTVAGRWSELHVSGRIAQELYALFAPEWGPMGKVIHLPPLRERREDLPDLVAHFCHRYSRLHRKAVTQVHPHVLAVLQRTEFPGNVRQLARTIETAIQSAEGDTLRAPHLPMEVPGRYRVLRNSGDGLEEREVSFKELGEFTDPHLFDLFVRFGLAGGRPSLESLVVHGQAMELADERLVRLLFLLMTHAGQEVDVKRHKRALGWEPKDRLRRFIFELRQALGDTEVRGTRSKFFTSRWGERCAFNADVKFCLIRELPSVNE